MKENNIIITQDETTNLTGGKTIFKGIVLKHKSGKWILSTHYKDKNADEIVDLGAEKEVIAWVDLDEDLQDRIVQTETEVADNTNAVTDHESRIGYMEGLSYVTEIDLITADYASADDLTDAEAYFIV